MFRVIEYFAKSLKVTGNGTIRYTAYEFLLAVYGNYGPLYAVSFSEIKRDIGRKSRFFIPHLPPSPPLEGSRLNTAIRFGAKKSQELFGYPMVKKYDYTFNHFDRIPACDGRMDGQTD